MFGTWGKLAGVWWLSAVVVISVAPANAAEPEFRFDHDTLAFANQTVFEYHEGHASLRNKSAVKRDAYNRHCFVLCRTAMQFKKFARFDRHGALLDDASLAARVRVVTHRAAWAEPLPEDQRIVFPGYKDLREMSKARRELLQIANRSHPLEPVPDNHVRPEKRLSLRRAWHSALAARFQRHTENDQCEMGRNPPTARNKFDSLCELQSNDAGKPSAQVHYTPA